MNRIQKIMFFIVFFIFIFHSKFFSSPLLRFHYPDINAYQVLFKHHYETGSISNQSIGSFFEVALSPRFGLNLDWNNVFYGNYDSFISEKNNTSMSFAAGFKYMPIAKSLIYFQYQFHSDQRISVARYKGDLGDVKGVVSPYSEKTGAFLIGGGYGMKWDRLEMCCHFEYSYHPSFTHEAFKSYPEFQANSNYGLVFGITPIIHFKKSALTMETYYNKREKRGYYFSSIPLFHFQIKKNIALFCGVEFPVYGGEAKKFYSGVHLNGLIEKKKKSVPRILTGSVRADTDSLTVVKVEKRRFYVPMLRTVFFNENESMVNSYYSHFMKRENIENYDCVDDVSVDLLHCLGVRLRAFPEARLKIKGFMEKKEKRNVDRRRAENIKKYLVNNYQISKERIHVEAAGFPVFAAYSGEAPDKAREENRRVEFFSNEPNLFLPIRVDGKKVVIDKECVDFKLDYENTSPIRSWKLEITRDDSLIKEYIGDGPPPPFISWDLKDFNNQRISITGSEQFQYRFILKDDKNKRFETTRRTVKVVETPNTCYVERIRIQLSVFSFNKVETDMEFISYLLDEINECMKRSERSKLFISGYTDNMGELGYNEKLSRKRAEIIKKELIKIGIDKDRIKTAGKGEMAPLMSNDTPQGRFYNRRVEIILDINEKK